LAILKNPYLSDLPTRQHHIISPWIPASWLAAEWLG